MISRKKILSSISIALVASLTLGCALPVNAISSEKIISSDIISDNSFNTYTQTFYDDNNQKITIITNINENGNNVNVYIDDKLTQIAVYDEISDTISVDYYGNSTNNYKSSSQTYQLSDLVQDVAMPVTNTDSKSSNDNYQTTALEMDGWTLYGTYPPNLTLSGSKTCKLYFRNYDEEPDLHKYMGKTISFTAGTLVSAVVSALAAFLTGATTILEIVIALGSGISGDFITQAISGNVCFSTQKILYAPIINDKYVWYDAYITKRWIVTHDYINNKDSFILNNACYDSNRGNSPDNIAFNAQAATMMD